MVILTLHDERQGMLQVVALSQTPEAQKAMSQAKVPFLEIQIPADDTSNLTVKVSREQQSQIVSQWSQVLSPPLTSENANQAQQAAGIQTTTLVPIIAKGKSLGVLMFGMAKPQEMVSEAEQSLMRGFTDIVAIAVENARLYSSLDEASKQLATANEKLKELDRLKDEFVSTAAHALRSPMTAIKGYISMVLEGDGGNVPDKAGDYLKSAYEGNDRLIRLVNHMLDISRIESGRLIFNIAEVNLEDTVQSEVDSMSILAKEKGLSLEYQKPKSPLPKVRVDPDRIREVINNLLGNAIKFTSKGGISVSHEIKDNQLLTHFIDTGQGIAPEDLKNLFQKFTQARLSGGKTSGSGLGLYVSKIIMNQFGGDITVTSELNRGSTFTFSIPIKKR